MGRFIFALVIFYIDCFSFINPAGAQSLDHFVRAQRYDQIVTFSLYQLTRTDCLDLCSVQATLNAMRGSILEGDAESALLFGRDYLENLPQNSNHFELSINKIKILTAYSYALNSDIDGFQNRISTLNLDAQQRLLRLIRVDAPLVFEEIQQHTDGKVPFPELSIEEKSAWNQYEQIPKKNPWVAGVSNLILPGSGYAYLGMWQTAFLNAFITGLCIGSSIELFEHNMNFSGMAVGAVGSVFYIGGALGASRSANDINQRNSKEPAQQLRSLLLPELRFEF
jgi:hypothetical protein